MAESVGEPEATLASKINKLFQLVRKPDGEQLTNEEVATACREATGESFSATYLWQMRTGRRDNPTKRHLEALANFFDVPVAYFFDDEHGKQIRAEIELLGALRNTDIRNVALRAVNLSTDGLGTITDIIDAMVKREVMRRSANKEGANSATHDDE
jgi:transcriptional regulator with XRE-family HTH domain